MVSFSTSNFCDITQTGLVWVKWCTAIFIHKAFSGFPADLIWVFLFIGLSDQLYVVDASLLELLESPFGLFLQWECKALEILCTLVQAKLHGDLWDRKIEHLAKPRRVNKQNGSKIRWAQTRARAVGVPIRLRSSWEHHGKFRECLQQTTPTAMTKKKKEHTLTTLSCRQQRRKHTPASAVQHNPHRDRATALIQLYLCHSNLLQFLLHRWERRRGGAGRGVSQVSLIAKVVLHR